MTTRLDYFPLVVRYISNNNFNKTSRFTNFVLLQKFERCFIAKVCERQYSTCKRPSPFVYRTEGIYICSWSCPLGAVTWQTNWTKRWTSLHTVVGELLGVKNRDSLPSNCHCKTLSHPDVVFDIRYVDSCCFDFFRNIRMHLHTYHF